MRFLISLFYISSSMPGNGHIFIIFSLLLHWTTLVMMLLYRSLSFYGLLLYGCTDETDMFACMT